MTGTTENRAPTAGLLRFLVPWIAPALFDAYLALGSWPRPAAWQFVGEITLMGLAGRAQWRLARGWLRTLLLPSGMLVVFAMLVHKPEAPHQLVPFLVGLVGAVVWVLRFVGRRWDVPPGLATLAALAVVIGARWLDVRLLVRPEGTAVPSVLADVVWPLARPRPPAHAGDGPPLVVISVDTLRADAAATMETFRRLGARGAVWPRAMSTSCWTLPALASLQTGRMPAEHGAGCLEDGHCQGIVPDVALLAEDLRAAGYTTAAVVSNPWVGSGTGFDRGFDTFRESGYVLNRLLVTGPPYGIHRQDDARLVDAAVEWLAGAPRRGFYLWVHVFGPHMPYRHAARAELQTIDPVMLRSGRPLSERERASLRAAYDDEVAYTDRQLLRLVDALERRGVLDDGVVVFTADHGEEFWDHGGIEHGHSHHGEIVDVPLVVVAPGVRAESRRGIASLIDVAPTLRAIAGLPPHGLDLRGEIPDDRIARAWGGLILHIDCSAREGSRRVISRDCSDAPSALFEYDLVRDPNELVPLPPRREEKLVQAALAITAPGRGLEANLPAERLRALGYVE